MQEKPPAAEAAAIAADALRSSRRLRSTITTSLEVRFASALPGTSLANLIRLRQWSYAQKGARCLLLALKRRPDELALGPRNSPAGPRAPACLIGWRDNAAISGMRVIT